MSKLDILEIIDDKTINNLLKKKQKELLKEARQEEIQKLDKDYYWGLSNGLGYFLYIVLCVFLIRYGILLVVVLSLALAITSFFLMIASISLCDFDCRPDPYYIKTLKIIGHFTLITPIFYWFYILKNLKSKKLIEQKLDSTVVTQSLNKVVCTELETKQQGLLDQIKSQMYKQAEATDKLQSVKYSLKSKNASPEKIELVTRLIEKMNSQYEILNRQKITCLDALSEIEGYVRVSNETIEEEATIRTIQESYKLVEDSEIMIYDNQTHIHKLMEMRNQVLSQFEATHEALKLTQGAQLELARL